MALLDGSNLIAQPDGSFVGQVVFTVSADLISAVTSGQLALSVLVDGTMVARDTLDFAVYPAAPPAISILSSEGIVRAGSSTSFTFSIAGILQNNIAGLFGALLDSQNNTVVAHTIPVSSLSVLGTSLVGSGTISVPADVPPGAYSLRVTVVRADGAEFFADRSVQIIQPVSACDDLTAAPILARMYQFYRNSLGPVALADLDHDGTLDGVFARSPGMGDCRP